MTYKILLPVEEKTFAREQVNFLCSHRIPEDAELILLTVIKPLIMQDYGYAVPHHFFENLVIEEKRWASEIMHQAETTLKEQFPDLKIEKRIEYGSPAPEILHLAKEKAVNWIIVGSHGRSGFDKFFLGSVSQAVVNRSPCSVTVVRLPEALHDSQSQCKDDAALKKQVLS